ncbi:MAG: hypothetical protein WC526_02280 [Patescibacteria group bacterium]
MTYNFPLEPDFVDGDNQPINYSITTQPKKPRLHRIDQYHIEDCLKLEIGHFGRHILNRANADRPEQEKTFFIQHGPISRAQVFYNIKEEHLEAYIDIRCQYRGLWLSQNLELGVQSAGFGARPFFICSCGYRCSVLFLHPQKQYSFVCRHCLGLNYELNGINKNTKHGKVTFLSIWLNKLIKREESIRHRAYGNNVTRRFQAFARRYCKWQNLVEANKELINS